MNLKSKLLSHCKNHLAEKFTQLNDLIIQVENSLQSETKSTAGDKHETGRAMLQLEREKLGFQLKELENQQQILAKINPEISTKIVGLGSVVETSSFNYFIAISASEITFENKKYYCVSSASPIGKVLIGKSINDNFSINNNTGTIIHIK